MNNINWWAENIGEGRFALEMGGGVRRARIYLSREELVALLDRAATLRRSLELKRDVCQQPAATIHAPERTPLGDE